MKNDRERYAACLDAEMWGYPRRVGWEEVEMAAWFRLGPDGVFWFVARGETPGELVLHLSIRAEMQRRLFGREWMYFVRCIGMLLGYDRLRFLGEDPPKVASLLLKWGWTQDQDGFFLDLEGNNGSQTTEDSQDSIQASGLSG